MSIQSEIEIILDKVHRGEMSANEGNIEMIRAERVRIINSRVSKDIRSALSVAINDGRLCHMKKDGLLPEVYYHPNFESFAHSERRRIAHKSINAIVKVCC